VWHTHYGAISRTALWRHGHYIRWMRASQGLGCPDCSPGKWALSLSHSLSSSLLIRSTAVDLLSAKGIDQEMRDRESLTDIENTRSWWWTNLKHLAKEAENDGWYNSWEKYTSRVCYIEKASNTMPFIKIITSFNCTWRERDIADITNTINIHVVTYALMNAFPMIMTESCTLCLSDANFIWLEFMQPFQGSCCSRTSARSAAMYPVLK